MINLTSNTPFGVVMLADQTVICNITWNKADNVPKSVILQFFYPDVSVEQMREIIRNH